MEASFRPITVAPSIRNVENSRRPHGGLQQAHASCVVHGAGYLLRRGVLGFQSRQRASERSCQFIS